MTARAPAIGTMRDRVQFQRKDMATQVEGGHASSYTPIATVWARVHTLSPIIFEQADARSSRVTHTVVTRFRNDLSPGDRAIYRSRVLEILSAEDLNGRKAYLSCTCREIRVAG